MPTCSECGVEIEEGKEMCQKCALKIIDEVLKNLKEKRKKKDTS